MTKEFSAIVLAAGASSRMGVPKLSLQYDNKTVFIQNIVNKFIGFGCKEVVLVVNEFGMEYLNKCQIKFPSNVKIAINKHTDWHRFYSLKLGANELSDKNPVFVHNVDNPFIDNKVLKTLAVGLENADYINPEFEGRGGHPMLLSDKVIFDIKSNKENQVHLKGFLGNYKRLGVNTDDERILININTQTEYKKYFSS